MSNDYFNPTGGPGQLTFGFSSTIRAIFALIGAGFDKLPGLTGNASKAVVVNSGGTALTVTTGTFALAGNFATVGAHSLSVTLTADTSITLPTSGTLVNSAGTIANATTAVNLSGGTVAATTVTASSTVSANGNDANGVSLFCQRMFNIEVNHAEPGFVFVGYMIYIDSADGKLKAKSSGGTVTTLANP